MRTSTVEDPPVAATTLDLPELDFVSALAGFPQYRRFVLVRLDDDGLLLELRSLEDEGLRFVVVPPAPFFPSYEPEIDDASAELLGLTSAEDALLLVLLTVGESLETSTANLLAPVVVNTKTMRAAQVLLASGEHPMKAPLRSV